MYYCPSIMKSLEGNIMRVLMLSWEYPPRIVGGISRVVYGLARKLAAKGCDVHVITCWEMGSKDFEGMTM